MDNTTCTDPIARLAELIEEARSRGESEPHAATLATADPTSGQPSVRTVHVHMQPETIVFFANSRTGKARQLEWNPQAALCFFWRGLQEQVNIEGVVELLEADMADRLWSERSRESALVARASRQEHLHGDAEGFADRIKAERRGHSFERIPRPEHWSGYALIPTRLEFWATGWHRGRSRELFERGPDGGWQQAIQEP